MNNDHVDWIKKAKMKQLNSLGQNAIDEWNTFEQEWLVRWGMVFNIECLTEVALVDKDYDEFINGYDYCSENWEELDKETFLACMANRKDKIDEEKK